jgi:carbohydrate-specific outer membrane porin
MICKFSNKLVDKNNKYQNNKFIITPLCLAICSILNSTSVQATENLESRIRNLEQQLTQTREELNNIEVNRRLEQKSLKQGDAESLSTFGELIPASDGFSFKGYLRSGWFGSSNGAPQSYAIGSLGRMGNELSGWYDMIFNQNVYKEGDRSVDATITFDGNTGLEQGVELQGTDNNYYHLLDMYVRTKGFIKLLPEAELWVGRHPLSGSEIQMFDWKSTRTNVGAGFGLEKISLPEGRLNLAVVREDLNYLNQKNSDQGVDVNTTVFDVRYEGLSLSDELKLGFATKYQLINSSSVLSDAQETGDYYDIKNAFSWSAIINQSLPHNGFNEYTLQYITNSYASGVSTINGGNPDFGNGMNNYQGEHSNGYGLRFISQGEQFLFNNRVVLAHAFTASHGEDIYNYDMNLSHTDFDSLRVAVRPAYIWDNFNQSGVELGYFSQNVRGDSDSYHESGYKITAFHALKVGTSLLRSRPEIRFYTNYLKSDENEITNFVFNGDKHDQLSFGVQAELWWF